jgi:2-amino-4-hydroxy-6-hydroxymethyldihydropteridine diphosphokinase
MKTQIAYLGIGTNLGDRINQLHDAIKLLQQTDEIDVVDLSSVYETEPVGYLDQPLFLNMVAKIETTCSAINLLTKVLEVENKMHRVRTIRWGPRIIDIDILLYEDEVYDFPHLQIPHPRMWQRSFVLVPLLDVVDHKNKEIWEIPQKLAVLPDQMDVRKIADLDFIND